MSTMVLQRDYEGKKKGDTVSVPFGKGRDMLKAGIAAYAPPSAPNKAIVAPVAKSETEMLREQFDKHLAELTAKHKAELEQAKADARIANDEAKAAMELADKATAENAELKKQLADKKAK